jgi:N-acetylmuramate 1-kinase
MENRQDILRLLSEVTQFSKVASTESHNLELKKINADGSNRRFYRISMSDLPHLLAIIPPDDQVGHSAESESTWKIGCHLSEKGLPVPKMYGRSETTGIVLLEDLGDLKLYDCIMHNKDVHAEDRQRLYLEAVAVLASLQIEGREGFDSSWCWDTPRYDQQVMFERESMYFLNSFWCDMLGNTIDEGVKDEFRDIARKADTGQDYFLHRDYQSRNLMVLNGKIRVIDFQGGRLGPLGYDVASLLIDPYVALPMEFQEKLVEHYSDILTSKYNVDVSLFRFSYPYLSLQRNLQILGAYSFLYMKRKKKFFARFITPSLEMLRERLTNPEFSSYTRLKKCVENASSMKGFM